MQSTTQEESHSGGTSVEFYTNVTLLSTLMSQRWQYATSVTLMVMTVLWQRWQQHQCVIDVNWQRCNNGDNDNAVTLLCTLVWQRCQLTALWQRCSHYISVTMCTLRPVSTSANLVAQMVRSHALALKRSNLIGFRSFWLRKSWTWFNFQNWPRVRQ